MKRRDLNYLIFAGIGSFAASLACLAVVLITANRTLQMKDYPTYNYADYVDCTSSKTFSSTAGGQLYEAESLSLAGSCKVSQNIHASKQEVVSSLNTGSTLTFTFEAKSMGDAKLIFATSYSSQTNRTIRSENLFRLNVNSYDVTLSSFVVPSYNEFDFIENDISLIHILEGKNTITITSFDNSYTLDYLVLVPPQKRSDDSKAINYHVENFLSKGRRQEYEAEIQNNISGAVILEEADRISEYAVFFTNPGDSITYYINSDEEALSDLNLISRKKDKTHSAPSIVVYVNEVPLEGHNMSKLTPEYTDMSFGTISLQKGLNTITIQNRGGSFYLDAISLNNEINISNSDKQIIYEAEDCITQGCLVRLSDVPSKKIVGYNNPNSYIEYRFNCLERVQTYLALHISYNSPTAWLKDVISIVLNGMEINESSDSMLMYTGGFDNYVDVYAGRLTIPQGKSILRIVSRTGNYNLDYFTLFNTSLSAEKSSAIMESENGILNQQKIYYQENASNQQITRHKQKGASGRYYIYCEEERYINITNVLSYVSLQNCYADDLFDMTLNSRVLNNENILIPGSSSVSHSQSVDFGSVLFQKGLNVLEFSDYEEEYYFDYCLLTI